MWTMIVVAYLVTWDSYPQIDYSALDFRSEELCYKYKKIMQKEIPVKTTMLCFKN